MSFKTQARFLELASRFWKRTGAAAIDLTPLPGSLPPSPVFGAAPDTATALAALPDVESVALGAWTVLRYDDADIVCVAGEAAWTEAGRLPVSVAGEGAAGPALLVGDGDALTLRRWHEVNTVTAAKTVDVDGVDYQVVDCTLQDADDGEYVLLSIAAPNHLRIISDTLQDQETGDTSSVIGITGALVALVRRDGLWRISTGAATVGALATQRTETLYVYATEAALRADAMAIDGMLATSLSPVTWLERVNGVWAARLKADVIARVEDAAGDVSIAQAAPHIGTPGRLIPYVEGIDNVVSTV